MRAWLPALLFTACASSAPEPKAPPVAAGPGLTFTWPRDGQRDVPVRASVVLHFSDPIAAMPAYDCSAVCVEGPAGAVPGTLSVVGGDTLVFAPAAPFDEATLYRVRVSAGAVMPQATNLGADPLLRFTTRVYRPIPGAAATVLALQDAPLDGGALPFLDASPVRLIFSEPIDPATVTSSTVTLEGPSGAVPAHLSAGGVHVVVDPTQDLTPGTTFTLAVHGVRDLGGEAVPDLSAQLVPQRSAPDEGVVRQKLAIAPPWTEGSTATSELSGFALNASRGESPLIGTATLGVIGGALEAELGAGDAFGGPIPMILRRGQTLDLSPLAVAFGGEIASGYQTRTLHFTLLNDTVGYLTRSPYRPATQLPDDKAPPFIDLTMDTLVTADDPQGNAMSAQTLMGVRLLGLSRIDGDQLVIDQVGALELGTLGINVAPTALSLRTRTGAMVTSPAEPAPRVFATFPASGSKAAAPDGKVELVFTAPVSATLATFTLTENGAAVPFTHRVDGSVVIVQPSRRLADGARVGFSWSGLTTLRGAPVQPASDDALSGQSTLAFDVAPFSATAAPPKLLSLTVGAPCALVRQSFASGGACSGGQTTDDLYVAFSMPANQQLAAGFTQPMRGLQLGAGCDTGAVRVERLDAAGTCVEAVKGTLRASDRGFRFVPAAPWVEGTHYRLVLVAGANATCASTEICSVSGVPLDTDPLAGSSAGGPDVVVPFTGAAATPDSSQPFASEPYTDVNDNGAIDPDETVHDENRVAMEVTGTTGIVTSASLNGADCVPALTGTQVCTALHAELPVTVGKVLAQCPVSANGAIGQGSGPCLQVRVLPNSLLNTSLSMDTRVVGIVPMNDLPTRQLIMRVREPSGPAYGYIIKEASAPNPVFVIRQSIYLDAPDLSIAGGLASHDLQSKPLDVVLKGPVTFLPDGRMRVAMANLADVPLSVNIRALGLSGGIQMRIPKGEMHLTVVGDPLR
ncbi:MAG: Ig-like domain-containing protein [Archangiaceae bacterium]|nr:Ig-like domain-containing protein [Archangiaceae bacterium]